VARVLVVDDEEPVRALLVSALRFSGFEVDGAPDAVSALSRLAATPSYPPSRTGDGCDLPDLIVLDVMMPGIDGFELLSVLRSRGVTAPVLFLTARGDVEDRVHGLKAGADDYVAKPFSVAEVTARVEALLRRSSQNGVNAEIQPAVEPVLRLGDLELDSAGKRVTRSGRMIDLSPTEFRLLEHLMSNQGRVLSKAQLLERVWGYDFGDTNVVERFISSLRRKIADQDAALIRTVRGFGYSARTS
jgi:two-component system OmpR family response regulator